MNQHPQQLAAQSISERIDERALQIWNERERHMPRFVRQTWDEGTDLARSMTRRQAATELGFDWRDF